MTLNYFWKLQFERIKSKPLNTVHEVFLIRSHFHPSSEDTGCLKLHIIQQYRSSCILPICYMFLCLYLCKWFSFSSMYFFVHCLLTLSCNVSLFPSLFYCCVSQNSLKLASTGSWIQGPPPSTYKKRQKILVEHLGENWGAR